MLTKKLSCDPKSPAGSRAFISRRVDEFTGVSVWVGRADTPIKGTVFAVESRIDPGTRTIKARAKIPNGLFVQNGKQYSVVAQADRESRNAPLDLSSVYVRNNRNELVQLDYVVELSYRASPPQLYRFNRYVSATVNAAPARGYTLGDGIDEMD